MRTELYRRYWQRVASEWRGYGPGVVSRWNLKSPDPTVSMSLAGRVPGTLPEKLLFRALEERGITFMFSYYMGDIPMTEKEEKYRPDFVLPDYNIIIDVFGVFWHGMQGKYQADYTRALLMAAVGWKIYIVTDAEVMMDPVGTLDSIPELRGAIRSGGKTYIGDRFDPTASLRSQRQAWPKGVLAHIRGGTKKTGYGFKAAGARVPKSMTPDYGEIKPGGPVFQEWMMDPVLVKEYQKYGKEWKAYIANLRAYFASAGRRRANPTLYYQYLEWERWWKVYGRI